ncbi:hypothetical protein FBU30_010149 [Linnemannia zychae]|nr:hypothetical protein FBU30_010149 [Linnemannia zychae]
MAEATGMSTAPNQSSESPTTPILERHTVHVHKRSYNRSSRQSTTDFKDHINSAESYTKSDQRREMTLSENNNIKDAHRISPGAL